MPTNTKPARAAHVVASAVLGLDTQSVTIAGRVYIIPPPTIRRLAAAAVHLSDVDNSSPVATIGTIEHATKALSCFICGDESLSNELGDATFQELADALAKAVEMLSPENFIKLSVSVKNVLRLTANPKP